MFPSRRITLGGGDVFRDEYSLEFDGTNDYVDLGVTSNFTSLQGARTISSWVKVNDTSGNDYFVFLGNTSNGFSLGISSSNNLSLFSGSSHTDVTTGNGASVTITEASMIDVWIHLGLTYDGSQYAKVYVDGSLIMTTDVGALLTDQNANTLIGARNSATSGTTAGQWMKANISEAAIYNTALSASQVATLYNGREPYNHKEGVATGNLVSWWRMGDGVLDDRITTGLVADQVNATLGSELFADGDMEIADTGDEWKDSTGGEATISKDTSNPYAGSRSLKALRESGAGGFSQAVTTVVGTTYKYTGYVYISASSWSPAWDDAANMGAGGVSLGTELDTTGEWISFTHYFAATATTMYVGGWKGTNDTYVLVDNLSLKAVGGNPGILTNFDGTDFKTDTP